MTDNETQPVPVSGPNNEVQVQERKKLRFISLGDLMERPDPECDWLVDRLLPQDGLSVIAAPAKAGKSTTARTLIHAVSTGKEWMGRPVAGGKVLHLSLEERPSTLKNHYGQMGTPGDAVYVLDGPPPKPKYRAALLEDAIRETGAKMAVVDTLLKWVFIQDLNSYSEVSRSMERYIAMSRNTSCHLLFVHHSRKTSGANGAEVLGSVALGGAFDTILSMRWEEGGRRTLYGFGRDDAALEAIVLRRNEQGEIYRASHQGRRRQGDHRGTGEGVPD